MEQTLEKNLPKYRDLKFLVQGGMGTTYTALDQEGRPVLLKELHFRLPVGMSPGEAWKGYDLFEREGKVLQQLSHPQLPRFIESYVQEGNGETKFFLVQQYLPHQSLEEHLRKGKVFTEEETVLYAQQLLEILGYLHAQVPPILHRDVKPNNILLDEQEKKVYLVDFGSVGFDLAKTVGGSTMLGTPGYAPLDQLIGKAVPGSDIYSLGATLFRLLARKEPADSLLGTRLDIRSHLRTTDRLAEIIEKMTEPEVSRRYQSAREVLEQLEGKVSLQKRGKGTLEMVMSNYQRPRWKYYAVSSMLALLGVSGITSSIKGIWMLPAESAIDPAISHAAVAYLLTGFFTVSGGICLLLGGILDYVLLGLRTSRPAKKLQREYSQFKDQYDIILAELIEQGKIEDSKAIFSPDRLLPSQLPPIFAAKAAVLSRRQQQQRQQQLPPQFKDALLYDYAVHQAAQGNLLEARLASLRINNDKVKEELEKEKLWAVPKTVVEMISRGMTDLPGLQRLYLHAEKHRLTDLEGKPVTASLLAQEVKNRVMSFNDLQDIVSSTSQHGQQLGADAFSITEPVNAHGNTIFTISYYRVRGKRELNGGKRKEMKEPKPSGNGK